jgi:hypothetical protein
MADSFDSPIFFRYLMRYVVSLLTGATVRPEVLYTASSVRRTRSVHSLPADEGGAKKSYTTLNHDQHLAHR